MKALNNKDFDQAFKERMTESFPEFEEAAWLKMEKKLQKKERLVFYRNASIILLFLSFGLGFYLIGKKNPEKSQSIVVKTLSTPKSKIEQPVEKPILISDHHTISKQDPNLKHLLSHLPVQQNEIRSTSIPIKVTDSGDKTKIEPIRKTVDLIASVPSSAIEQTIPESIVKPSTATPTQTEEKPQKTIREKRKIPISLAISAGPDFNSTIALVGGKVSTALGVNVGVGLTKKLSVQTGLIYSAKNYTASNYDYTFNNPNIRALVESIQAACKVLEIPLRASYNINENEKRSIEVNAGLSSYLMLKENYVFKYTAASGRKDRINDITNANQHFLSVVELSATYYMKLKNKNLALGIEPYLKVPLSGIGEGNVPLKSSGVSFKLRYDFNKK